MYMENKYLDLSSVVRTIQDNMKEGYDKGQLAVIYDLLKSFFDSTAGKDYNLDAGQVSCWFNGSKKISPAISTYYVAEKHQGELANDIREIFKKEKLSAKVIEEVYDLLVHDGTIVAEERGELAGCYPDKDRSHESKAVFLASVLCFVMGRPFAKRDRNGQKVSGEVLPVQRFYRSYNELLVALNKKCMNYSSWKADQMLTEKFLSFVRENLRELSTELPLSEIFPVSQCVYEAEKNPTPIFYARCLLMGCKLELRCPDWRDDDEKKRYLRKWMGELRRISDNCKNSAVTELAYIEAVCPDEKPIASLIRAEMYLLSADCYAQLSALDSRAAEEDKDRCFFIPGRKALEAAGNVLETVKRQYGEESDEYRKLREHWKHIDIQFPKADSGSYLPQPLALHLSASKKTPQETKLIYSTAFDSAAGQPLDVVEAHMLQLAGSPNIKLVLQLPQLLDNPNITGTLFHNAGFKSLCQEGIIVLSSYTSTNGNPIIDPRDYIIERLKDPNFHFSASQALNDSAVREMVLMGLIRNAPFCALSLPSELEPIYDAYISSSELFYPSDIKKYHQDSRYHPGGKMLCGLWRKRTLSEMVNNRIDMLKKDDERVHIEGRRERLETLADMQCAASCAEMRSSYYSLIEQWRDDRVYNLDDLDLFKKLVDLCYGFSSGYRSTERILDLSSDEILRIHAQIGDEIIDPTGVMAYTVDLAKKRASGLERVGTLDFENVLRISKISRRVAAEVHAEKELLMEMLRAETGLGYSGDSSSGTLITDYCMRSVYDGSTSYISPCEQKESGEELNMEFNIPKGRSTN